ncbi:uncharacterized protein LOC128953293 [Oppia nitens]|uniref:uncharacterized protein LOC128953293 n=1 Tax=Oppia nitens TaxID=1686743 RepID=UPI0023DCBE1F|nr:uncharacterized protein LOC128953293 [Oppia nitens]
MNKILAISCLAILLTIINGLASGCQVNDPWPKQLKLNQAYLTWTDKKLLDEIDKVFKQKCKLYKKDSDFLKKAGLEWAGSRQAAGCQRDWDESNRIVKAIEKLPKFQKNKHWLLVTQTQWVDYWNRFYHETDNKQLDCSIEQLQQILNTQSLDSNGLIELLQKKRNQVLAKMQKQVDNDTNDKNSKFFKKFDQQTLDDIKQIYSVDDKQLAKIQDNQVKVGTLIILLLESEYYIRGYSILLNDEQQQQDDYVLKGV